MRRTVPMVALLIAACGVLFLAPAAQAHTPDSLHITIKNPVDGTEVKRGEPLNIRGQFETSAEAEELKLVSLTVEIRGNGEGWLAFVEVPTTPATPSPELPAAGEKSRTRDIAIWTPGEQITRGGNPEALPAGTYSLRVVATVMEEGHQVKYTSRDVRVTLAEGSGTNGIIICKVAIAVESDDEPQYYTTETVFRFSTNLGTCFQAVEWDFRDRTTSPFIQVTHQYTAPGTYIVQLTAWSDTARSQPGKVDSLTVQIKAAPPPLAVTRHIAGFPSSLLSGATTVLPTKDPLVPNWVRETQVQLDVQFNATSGTFVLREEIPAGWTMTLPPDSPAMLTRQVKVGDVDCREWLLQGSAQTVAITYTLTPPDSAPLKKYSLRGTVTTDFAGGAVDVVGDTDITLDSKLPIEVVLSHLEWAKAGATPEELHQAGAVALYNNTPLDHSDTISEQQVRLAEAYWVSDAVVPFTGGLTMTSATLLKLISQCDACRLQ